jgi:GntR family transcriptional regulator
VPQLTPDGRVERRWDRARQVRELLRFDLFGRATFGDLLPSERDLIARYGCTRNVLREALQLLREEGLIRRVQGTGSFAIVSREVYELDALSSFAEQLGRDRIKVDIVEARAMAAPAVIADLLSIDVGSDVLLFERRIRLDGMPIVLATSYFTDVALGMLDEDLTEDFYDLLEGRIGLRLGKAEISVAAMPADRSVTALLSCPPTVSVLHLTRRLRTEDGVPLEFGFVHIRSDVIRFVELLDRKAITGIGA